MSSQNITSGSPLVSSLKQGSGTFWTPTPTRPCPPFLARSGFPSPLYEPLFPLSFGRSRSGRSLANAFSLPGNSASVSTGSKRAKRPSVSLAKKAKVGHDLPEYFDDDDDDDDQDTLGLDGEVITRRTKKAKVGHISMGDLDDVESTWGMDDEDILEEGDDVLEDDEEVLEDGEEILDEEEEGPVEATAARLQAKRAAADQLGLAADFERGESWGSMFLARCTGEKGLKNDLVRFIEEQKSRSVGQSLEPIESSIEVRHRDAWPTHCEEVDKHWNPFVDNVVQLAQGKLAPAQDFSKPTGPRNARLYVVWHYPTYAVEVKEWGMISSRKNPSIGQQVRKIGLPQDVCTDDMIPIRSKDGTTDQDRYKMWPDFDLIKKACVQRIWENLEHQRFAILMGGSVVDAIGTSVPNKYTRHIMYLNLGVSFLGSRQPFFWVLRDSRTHKIELVLFCCWHLAFFQPRYAQTMDFRLCADLLLNAICEFSGVPVADPTFFQDLWTSNMKVRKVRKVRKAHSAGNIRKPKYGVTHQPSLSSRRQRFKAMTPTQRQELLTAIQDDGKTTQDYFGQGYTADRILAGVSCKIDFDSQITGTLSGRRRNFRGAPEAKRQEILESIQACGKTPEDYFGQGYTADRILAGVSCKIDFDSQITGTLSGRRRNFRGAPEAKRQEILESIQACGKTPEDYFGKGHTVDRVLSVDEVLSVDQVPSVNRIVDVDINFDVSSKSREHRRSQFRKASEAKRQEILESIQACGKTPEDYFGQGHTVDQVLNANANSSVNGVFNFNANNRRTLSNRRSAFRRAPDAKRQKILKDIQDAGKTPEDYFGPGYSVGLVLKGGDILGGM